MTVTVTLKIAPDTVEEVIHLPTIFNQYKGAIESLTEQGAYLLPKEKITLRWLLDMNPTLQAEVKAMEETEAKTILVTEIPADPQAAIQVEETTHDHV